MYVQKLHWGTRLQPLLQSKSSEFYTTSGCVFVALVIHLTRKRKNQYQRSQGKTTTQYGTKARQHDNRQLINIMFLNDVRLVNI